MSWHYYHLMQLPYYCCSSSTLILISFEPGDSPSGASFDCHWGFWVLSPFYDKYLTYLLKCKIRFSPLKFVLIYVRLSQIHELSTEPDRVKPDRSELDHLESNQGLQCQIIMCDLYSSEILPSTEWLIPYQHYGRTYQLHLQGLRNP